MPKDRKWLPAYTGLIMATITLAITLSITNNPLKKFLINSYARYSPDALINQRERSGTCSGAGCLAPEIIANSNDPSNQTGVAAEILATYKSAMAGDQTALDKLKEYNLSVATNVETYLAKKTAAEAQAQLTRDINILSSYSSTVLVYQSGGSSLSPCVNDPTQTRMCDLDTNAVLICQSRGGTDCSLHPREFAMSFLANNGVDQATLDSINTSYNQQRTAYYQQVIDTNRAISTAIDQQITEQTALRAINNYSTSNGTYVFSDSESQAIKDYCVLQKGTIIAISCADPEKYANEYIASHRVPLADQVPQGANIPLPAVDSSGTPSFVHDSATYINIQNEIATNNSDANQRTMNAIGQAAQVEATNFVSGLTEYAACQNEANAVDRASCNQRMYQIEQSVTANNPIARITGIDNYIESFASGTTQAWQTLGYESIDKCKQDHPNGLGPHGYQCNSTDYTKEQLTASITAGSRITEIASLPVSIGYAASAPTILAGIGRTLGEIGVISTVDQTANTTNAWVNDPGSRETWTQTGLTALSWTNLGVADWLSGTISSGNQLTTAQKAINTAVSATNVVADVTVGGPALFSDKTSLWDKTMIVGGLAFDVYSLGLSLPSVQKTVIPDRLSQTDTVFWDQNQVDDYLRNLSGDQSVRPETRLDTQAEAANRAMSNQTPDQPPIAAALLTEVESPLNTNAQPASTIATQPRTSFFERVTSGINDFVAGLFVNSQNADNIEIPARNVLSSDVSPGTINTRSSERTPLSERLTSFGQSIDRNVIQPARDRLTGIIDGINNNRPEPATQALAASSQSGGTPVFENIRNQIVLSWERFRGTLPQNLETDTTFKPTEDALGINRPISEGRSGTRAKYSVGTLNMEVSLMDTTTRVVADGIDDITINGRKISTNTNIVRGDIISFSGQKYTFAGLDTFGRPILTNSPVYSFIIGVETRISQLIDNNVNRAQDDYISSRPTEYADSIGQQTNRVDSALLDADISMGPSYITIRRVALITSFITSAAFLAYVYFNSNSTATPINLPTFTLTPTAIIQIFTNTVTPTTTAVPTLTYTPTAMPPKYLDGGTVMISPDLAPDKYKLVAYLVSIFTQAMNDIGGIPTTQDEKNMYIKRVIELISQSSDPNVRALSTDNKFINYLNSRVNGSNLGLYQENIDREQLIQCNLWAIGIAKLYPDLRIVADEIPFGSKSVSDIAASYKDSRWNPTVCYGDNMDEAINNPKCDGRELRYQVDGGIVAARVTDYSKINPGDAFTYEDHYGVILDKYMINGKYWFLVTESNSPQGDLTGMPEMYLVSQDDFANRVNSLDQTYFLYFSGDPLPEKPSLPPSPTTPDVLRMITVPGAPSGQSQNAPTVTYTPTITATTTTGSIQRNGDSLLRSENMFNGYVKYFEYTTNSTRQETNYHVLSVDLDHAKFFVTPPNDPSKKTSDNLMTTGGFLDKYDMDIAINADGWYSYTDEFGVRHYKTNGLAASNGVIYGSNTEQTIFIDQNNNISIAPQERPDQVWNAVSFPNQLIKNGVIVPHPDKTDTNPRTALGITADNRLILVTVDGIEYSSGTTVDELTKLLQGMGAVDAVMFDSGTSSTMVVRDANGNPSTLNQTTCDSYTTQCQVANHLGIQIIP